MVGKSDCACHTEQRVTSQLMHRRHEIGTKTKHALQAAATAADHRRQPKHDHTLVRRAPDTINDFVILTPLTPMSDKRSRSVGTRSSVATETNFGLETTREYEQGHVLVRYDQRW